MNRRELVNAVASHIEADAKEVDKVLSGFTEVVTSTVSRGEQVAISGFAKFARVERAARMGRNPATGEQIHIKASKKARITPLKAFKDAVLGSGGAKKGGGAKVAAAKKGPATKKAAPKKAAPKKAATKKSASKSVKAPAAKKAAKRR